MRDTLLRLPAVSPGEAGVAPALARVAAAIARLDQALAGHSLLPAFLYRVRLEAVRRQAAVDGKSVDSWHLAAVLQGLRLRMDDALRIADRGAIFEAARHALHLHQWITAPDFDQDNEVQQAETAFAAVSQSITPLLAAAYGFHAWIENGGDRAPARAALIRHWTKHRLLRAPIPLTGPKALRSDTNWEPAAWVPAFLHAVADEAEDGLQLLFDMERSWFAARSAVASRRRNSRAAVAVDLLAAMSLVSPASLAASLGMAVGNAAALLDGFCATGIAVEVTHRSKRRLFGLVGLAPLREEVTPPRRPLSGRGRGRPPNITIKEQIALPPLPQSLLTRIERRAFDCSELDAAMALADATIRSVKRNLDALAGKPPPVTNSPLF